MKGDGEMQWICSCGWSADEDGSLRSMGLAGLHLREARKDGSEHNILGLYEGDQQIIKGLNLREARDKFMRDEVDIQEPTKGKKGKQSPQKAEAQTVGLPDLPGKSRKADVLATRIVLSDIVILLFQSDVRAHPELFPENVLTDERVFSDQLASWIETCVIQVHIDHADELGFNWVFDRIAQQMRGDRIAALGNR
jgi:hypothetical protein